MTTEPLFEVSYYCEGEKNPNAMLQGEHCLFQIKISFGNKTQHIRFQQQQKKLTRCIHLFPRLSAFLVFRFII